jgi:hypothetical protein
MYRGYLVDKGLIGKDIHFSMGCKFCHKGDDMAADRDSAHKGLVRRPSDNEQTCGMCHKAISDNYRKSLHYTTIGQRQGVMKRFSADELQRFDEKVFEKSCRSCHASCGGCHVKAPSVGGIGIGLIQGHKFVKRDEGKTCAFCHGGRVYPEFTGEYGGRPDVHYQKGKMCVDCHTKEEMHGDGNAYLSKNDVKQRPSCTNCHQLGQEKKLTARLSHEKHQNKVSCYGCHSSGDYRNCYDCHIETHSNAKPGFILGLNPRDKKTVTTLRLIPTVRTTFMAAGIKMEHFDALPNYWDTPAHNIRKRTDRTRSCDACHVAAKGFLTKEQLIVNGSKANEALIIKPKPLNR